LSVPKPFTPVEGLDHGAMKVWMWLRQDGKCLLCGEPIDMTIPRNHYGGASTEHKRPVVRGGNNGRGNLALTHWECNRNYRYAQESKRACEATYPREKFRVVRYESTR
jgi:5-methylcytosine-specific restriction endonuclease McrA